MSTPIWSVKLFLEAADEHEVERKIDLLRHHRRHMAPNGEDARIMFVFNPGIGPGRKRAVAVHAIATAPSNGDACVAVGNIVREALNTDQAGIFWIRCTKKGSP